VFDMRTMKPRDPRPACAGILAIVIDTATTGGTNG
jgi:hypothetical protein